MLGKDLAVSDALSQAPAPCPLSASDILPGSEGTASVDAVFSALPAHDAHAEKI